MYGISPTSFRGAPMIYKNVDVSLVHIILQFYDVTTIISNKMITVIILLVIHDATKPHLIEKGFWKTRIGNSILNQIIGEI